MESKHLKLLTFSEKDREFYRKQFVKNYIFQWHTGDYHVIYYECFSEKKKSKSGACFAGASLHNNKLQILFRDTKDTPFLNKDGHHSCISTEEEYKGFNVIKKWMDFGSLLNDFKWELEGDYISVFPVKESWYNRAEMLTACTWVRYLFEDSFPITARLIVYQAIDAQIKFPKLTEQECFILAVARAAAVNMIYSNGHSLFFDKTKICCFIKDHTTKTQAETVHYSLCHAYTKIRWEQGYSTASELAEIVKICQLTETMALNEPLKYLQYVKKANKILYIRNASLPELRLLVDQSSGLSKG